MKLILLSGQSLNNKGWIEEVRDTLNPLFDSSEVVYYEHWERGEEKADVAKESKSFVKLLNDLEGDYFIFAKSIGTVITLNSLPKLKKKPRGAVFVGVPYAMAKKYGYDFSTLKDLSNFPIFIYQKEHDPYSDFKDLKPIEGRNVEVKKYISKREPNDDHHYANMEYIKKLVQNAI